MSNARSHFNYRGTGRIGSCVARYIAQHTDAEITVTGRKAIWTGVGNFPVLALDLADRPLLHNARSRTERDALSLRRQEPAAIAELIRSGKLQQPGVWFVEQALWTDSLKPPAANSHWIDS